MGIFRRINEFKPGSELLIRDAAFPVAGTAAYFWSIGGVMALLLVLDLFIFWAHPLFRRPITGRNGNLSVERRNAPSDPDRAS